MKTPQLKLHSRGVYYTRHWHRGKDTFEYFSKDRIIAQTQFKEWLAQWAIAKTKEPAAEHRSSIRTVQVAEQWLTHTLQSSGAKQMQQYRSAITPFLDLCGTMPAAAITVEHLESCAADLRLAGYSPTTVRAYTKAPKTMLLWAARRKLIPFPNLTDLRLERATRPTPRYKPASFVQSYIASAADHHPQLRHWLSLIYLTCARPSEIHRLIHAYATFRANAETASPHGRFITLHQEKAPVAFETQGKTQRKTGVPRLVILTSEALSHLRESRPLWAHSSFLELAIDATKTDPSAPRGAKVLRSFGASELRKQGTPREDVKRILGHSTSEPIDHYVDESLAHLRALLSRLTLQRADASSVQQATEEDDYVPPT